MDVGGVIIVTDGAESKKCASLSCIPVYPWVLCYSKPSKPNTQHSPLYRAAVAASPVLLFFLLKELH